MASSASAGTFTRDSVCFDYEPLVRSVVKRLHVPDQLVEDARQEGRAALLQAFDHYNPASPVSFVTFARMYVRGAVIRNVYSRPQRMEMVGREPVGFGGEEDEPTFAFEDDLLLVLSLHEWLDTLAPKDQWLLWRVHWKNATTAAIATELNVTPRRINQRQRELLDNAEEVLSAA